MVITAEEIVSSWGTFRVVHEENDLTKSFLAKKNTRK